MFTMLLLMCGADPVPTFTGENRMPKFVGVNKMPAAPIRENWGGSWGWMEKGSDGVYRQVSGSGGAAPPFQNRPATMPATVAQPAGARNTSYLDSTATGRIITLVPSMGQLGGTSYCPPSG